MLTFWRNPETTLAALDAQFDRLLNDAAAPRWSYGLTPAADVLETEAGYRVLLDLPGLDPATIKLQVEKDTLSVQAERKQPAPVAGETVHHSERAFGTFFRSFTLPRGVDPTRVEASYEAGVLAVSLPKRDEVKPRTISVQVR
jgi:HSP20 family protein